MNPCYTLSICVVIIVRLIVVMIIWNWCCYNYKFNCCYELCDFGVVM